MAFNKLIAKKGIPAQQVAFHSRTSLQGDSTGELLMKPDAVWDLHILRASDGRPMCSLFLLGLIHLYT